MSEIMKLTIVEDISLICDLEPDESPYYIQTLYPSDVPNEDLDTWAQREVEPIDIPTTAYGYTDADGSPRLIEVQDEAVLRSVINAVYIQDTKIVMAHIYEEI